MMIKASLLSKFSSRINTCQLVGVVLASTFAVSSVSTVQAQEERSKSDSPFLESSWSLPAAPKPEDLLCFYTSDNQGFFIDPHSLNIASDNSLRYTMVTVSKSGAKNISYEALRCATYEKKLYAFGHADGSWSLSRNTEWTKISNAGANKQHSVLAHDFMCDGNSTAGDAAKILQRIRSNRPLNPYSN